MPKKRANNYKQLTIGQHIAMGSLRQNINIATQQAIANVITNLIKDCTNPKPTLASLLLKEFIKFNPPTESKQWKNIIN